MNRIEELNKIFNDAQLKEIFTVKKEDDYPERKYSSLRFLPNEYRIYAIEIWEIAKGKFFRIYHSHNIATEVKEAIDDINGQFRAAQKYIDFKGDFHQIANDLFNSLNTDALLQAAKDNQTLTKNAAYEGLALPDIDVSDREVLGRVFNWKEILAISEETTEENLMLKELSKNGVYLQRSICGESRYVGSAYNEGGIFSRWMKHLKSNGDAKHLNLFVLENGYNNLVFTVLEFTTPENSRAAEKRWKETLGTKNLARYDGLRLNKN